MNIEELQRLTDELSQALKDEKAAEREEAELKQQVAAKRKVTAERHTRVVELLDAIRTGEYQSKMDFSDDGGDTRRQAPAAGAKPAWYENKDDDPVLTIPSPSSGASPSSELVRERKMRLWLGEALKVSSPDWDAFRVPGLSDEDLAAELTKVPNHSHSLEDDIEPIYEWRTGPPRFYLRADGQAKLPPFPTLEGAPLIVLARHVLKIGSPTQTGAPPKDETEKGSEASTSDGPEVGPMDRDQALDRALHLREVAPKLTDFAIAGAATDAQILQVLRKWPVFRQTYGTGGGKAWGTVGGHEPRFFFDGDALGGNWTINTPTLARTKLAKAVRKRLGLKPAMVTLSAAKASFADVGTNADAVRKHMDEIESEANGNTGSTPAGDPRVARHTADMEREAKEKRNARDRARRAARRNGKPVASGKPDLRVKPPEPRHRRVLPSGAIELTPGSVDAWADAILGRDETKAGERETKDGEGETMNRVTFAKLAKEHLDAELRAALFYDGGRGWDVLYKAGATDDEILELCVSNWPKNRHFVRPEDAQTVMGHTIQGGPPKFWVGPYRGDGEDIFLMGVPLANAIRRVLGIVEPRSEDDPEVPWPEWSPMAKQGRAAEAQVSTWSGEDVDHELKHALTDFLVVGACTPWNSMRVEGATDDEIMDALCRHWPNSRMFVPRQRSRGKFGYTIQSGSDWACLWMGQFQAPGHKAELSGAALIDRIRLLLDIPRPAGDRETSGPTGGGVGRPAPNGRRVPTRAAGDRETSGQAAGGVGRPAPNKRPAPNARKKARANGKGVTMTILPPTFPMPEGGWFDEALDDASYALQTHLDDMILCESCFAARGKSVHPCPDIECGDPAFIPATMEAFEPVYAKSHKKTAAKPARRKAVVK